MELDVLVLHFLFLIADILEQAQREKLLALGDAGLDDLLLLHHASLARSERELLGEALVARRLRAGRVLLLGLLDGRRVGADLGVRGGDGLLEVVGRDVVLDEARELALVALGVALRQLAHVVGDVAGKDALAQLLSIELLALLVVTGEAVDRVRDVEATVDGALERSKDASTGRRADETDVEQRAERQRNALLALKGLLLRLTVDLDLALVSVGKLERREVAASKKQASGVR